MKKLYLKLLVKVFEKAFKKAGFSGDSWKFLLQTIISILTAILTALGTTSCMGLH